MGLDWAGGLPELWEGSAHAEAALATARGVTNPQLLHGVLAAVGLLFLEAGRRVEAVALARELVVLGPEPSDFATFAILLTGLGQAGDVHAAADRAVLQTPWVEAARAYATGRLARAADVLDEIGDCSTAAYVRLRAAEQLLAERHRAEGDEQLRRALAFYHSVGATRYVREGEALLRASAC